MGHSAADVWGYTPRQIAGFLSFAAARKKREYAERLSIALSGARGDPKAVQKQIKDLGE